MPEVGSGAFLTAFGVFYLINEIPEGKGASITTPFLSEQVSPVHVSEKKREHLYYLAFLGMQKFGFFPSCQRMKHIFWD